MTARGWWTVVLTALAGPLGSIGLGIALARWADATTGGMAGLAGGVAGLLLGAPLGALLAFAICLLTVMREVPMRRWLAMAIMCAAVIGEGLVMLVGLRLTGGMATPEIGLVAVAVAILLVLAAGAYAALLAARRLMPAAHQAD